ncbi:MAG TPA: T9SS type A sorting domain-containing protein [Candidatus Cloacimonetes bacterium]|nr:T9SS type A sorting domain-containing protein [Candidatus Cloacimonadota bacterium]HEX38074.1 T9SS type A sorting domain-containing protein [Candidatus Cloacimonadota bacterium]
MKKIVFVLIFILALASFLCADYYDGTEGLYGDELKTALYFIIKDHTTYSYDALRDYILPNTDEDPNNSNNVILIYTGRSQDKDTFGGLLDEWNREHVWAKSHGDFGNTIPCGTDAHHIRPCDVGVNSIRGNKDFDNGGSAVYGYYNDYAGNTDGDSFEPRDEVKGDIARMIMYMAVRYEGENDEPDLELVDYIPSSPAGQPYFGKESVLIQWHIDDPVDSFEITRNEKIYTNWQHNRNPFIDHPEFVERIWCYAIDDPCMENIIIKSYPNPFSTSTTLSFSLTMNEQELERIDIYNVKGQIVRTLLIFSSPFHPVEVTWDGRDGNDKLVKNGIYFYVVSIEKQKYVNKLTFMK